MMRMLTGVRRALHCEEGAGGSGWRCMVRITPTGQEGADWSGGRFTARRAPTGQEGADWSGGRFMMRMLTGQEGAVL